MLALGGCGGIASSDAPQCSYFSNTCNFEAIDFTPSTPTLFASVFPMRLTVQVGGTVTFTADASLSGATFQWRRSSDNGATWADIPGATGDSYTLSGVQLPDDGARFRVEVTRGTASVASFSGRLTVSSMPGVVIADGEFKTADWMATASPSPSAGGPVESIERVPDDGDPGAYRRMVDVMSTLPDSLRVLHVYQGGAYDPAIQGGVHAIDYTEVCRVLASKSTVTVRSALLLEQDGRTYSLAPFACFVSGWHPLLPLSSLVAADFGQIAGPACPAGVACPDFSATALPMRFGYVRSTGQSAGTAPVTIEHHIDDWAVTVWRR
ncbi:MAG: hypothetical protein ABI520_16100 [Caldimonas sp.]